MRWAADERAAAAGANVKQNWRVEQYVVDGSVTILALFYDSETAVLDVELRNGAIYRYFAVSRRMLEDFREASSPGRYFNTHLRGRHGEQLQRGRVR